MQLSFFHKLTLIFLPISFLTGPFLPDLMVVIIAIFSIFYLSKENIALFFKDNLLFLISFFFLIIVFSGLISVNSYASLILFDGPIFFFRYFFFIVGIIFILNKYNNLLKNIFYVLSISIVFVLFDAIFQWIFNHNIFGLVSPSIRISSIFGSEEILGHYLSFIVPIFFSLCIYFFYHNKKIINLLFIVFFISLFVSIISGDRTGFLKLFIFLIFLIICLKGYRKQLITHLFVYIIIALPIISKSENIIKRYNQTVHDVSQLTIPFLPFSTAHESHFKSSTFMFLDKPILGHGPQGFRLYCNNDLKYNHGDNACNSHPHNYYFQLLAETGMIGFITILLFFFKLLTRFYSSYFKLNLNQSDTRYLLTINILLFGSILNFLPLIAHFNFYNNWSNSMIYFNISLISYFYMAKKINFNFK